MAYKNLITRLIFSMAFFIIYILVSIYNFNYVFYLATLVYLIIFIEVLFYFKKHKIIIFSYLILSFLALINLNYTEKYFNYFNLMIIIIVTFDSFSYLVGKYIGKIKLLKISPNKTLEGLLGGIFFSMFLSLLYSYIYSIEINTNLILGIQKTCLFQL